MCRLEKLVASLAAGDETGPLEATIKNLQREIDTKVQTVIALSATCLVGCVQ